MLNDFEPVKFYCRKLGCGHYNEQTVKINNNDYIDSLNMRERVVEVKCSKCGEKNTVKIGS